jgi:hypothetical protein
MLFYCVLVVVCCCFGFLFFWNSSTLKQWIARILQEERLVSSVNKEVLLFLEIYRVEKMKACADCREREFGDSTKSCVLGLHGGTTVIDTDRGAVCQW